MKGKQIEKEEVKLSLLGDVMILYIENPKVYKKLLELINGYRKFAGYKITIQNSTVFLYSCNKQSENEIKKIFIYKSIKRNKMFRNR